MSISRPRHWWFLWCRLALALCAFRTSFWSPISVAEPSGSPTADFYFQSASNKRDSGDLGGAIADFTRALEVDPNRADAYIQRGKLHLKQRMFDRAVGDFTRAIELAPNDPTAYVERGEAKEQQGDPGGAMDDFLHTLTTRPTDDRVLQMVIERKRKSGDLDRVIAITTRALAPQLMRVESLYLSRASAKEASGDTDGAIEDLTHAIEARPDNYNSYESRARLFYRKGAWKEALDSLVDARPVLHSRGREYVHLHIWVLRMKLGQKDEADRELIAYLAGKRNDADSGDWKVAGFLLGRVPESAFFPMKDPNLEQLRSWPLEARQSSEWYYIGMKRLFAGDKVGAAECFQKSAPGPRGLGQIEYPFAKAELKALGQ
jgi:tetratricopeptide (TPR) repeat protein